ncbi:hypothetical protein ACS7SF_10735 [Ralstonia sp. 25C]|uniref:hypothetical protein n=1 Tax=Ralstonia sp. 25C TaxID=3447363 RepID=UPI003F74E91A
MDALSNPPSRQPTRRYGAVVALLLVIGGLCLALGQSKDIGWLAGLNWHLGYDAAGTALLWLGGLLMLPQITYSLWVTRGPGARGVMYRQVGVALAMAVALLVLAIAPDNVSIAHDHPRDSGANTSGDQEPVGTTEETTYAFHGFRALPGARIERDAASAPTRSVEGRPSRVVWRGDHSALTGTLDTFETYAPDDTQPKGYECLTRTQRYFGPFSVLHLSNVRDTAEAAARLECKPITHAEESQQ